MRWIRLGLIAAALVSAASVSSAQGPQGGPQAGRGGGARMLLVGIELTDAQKDQLEKITAKYRAERQALMPAGGMQGGPPDDATRAKMLELNTKSEAEYRAILTADQQKVFDKNIEDRKARMEQRQKDGA